MSIIIDDTGTRLAARLRLEREARGWSLADLAARAGLAKATISKIERGEISPTAVTLVRLATAFDLTLAGLLLRAEGGDRLVRAAEQPLWRDPASGYVRRQIFARPDHPVELVEVELPPGARVALPASSLARIRQIVQLRAGELVIVEGETRHALRPGDCLGFGPPADIVFANETDAPCRYLVALTRL
ncbi:helix-turn-helix domain-containing protein [Ancylobacter terrae]|uniref:helix-turn-helix domain-containing protein n=1 Tax=Ancylobacter sp. sgz301288 TaxID=3342077 RepID=UPI00385FA354